MLRKIISCLFPILLAFFYLFAAGSIACFLFAALTLNDRIFWFADALLPFWIFNPAPLIAPFFCNKWRFLPLAVYMLCAIALVVLTGGV